MLRSRQILDELRALRELQLGELAALRARIAELESALARERERVDDLADQTAALIDELGAARRQLQQSRTGAGDAGEGS